MSEDTTTSTGPSEFASMFDDWIAGATLAHKSLDIYGQPALQAEYEKLTRELEVAKAAAKDTESALTDESEVDAIEAKLVALYEQWMASKSTWTVRAMPTELAAELSLEHPDQPQPDDVPADATAEAKAQHTEAMKAWRAASDARNFAILEQTVVRIEWADGRKVEATFDTDNIRVDKPAVTVAQLKQMRSRLGDVQYLRLLQASTLASMQEPVIPAPFLRSSSKTEKT